MPVAKEKLYIGFTLAANVGNYVSADAVKQYGWEDKVEPDKPAEAKQKKAASE